MNRTLASATAQLRFSGVEVDEAYLNLFAQKLQGDITVEEFLNGMRLTAKRK